MSFTSDMRAFAEKGKRGYDEVVRESLINLSASILIKTPVDTGETANNWRPTVQKPADGVIEGAGSTQEQHDRIKRGVSAAVGGVYYYVNNLPWMHRLEFEGWSDKAPAGMVRLSVIEYQQHLRDAISKL